MLVIRLARVGKRGHATFRVVVTEHTRPPKSGALAQLGSYDPHANRFSVDAEKVKGYLAHGAKPSPTVHNLLIEHKVIEGKKVRAWKPKRKKQEEGSTKQGETTTSATPEAAAAGPAPQAVEKKPPTPTEAPKAEEKYPEQKTETPPGSS